MVAQSSKKWPGLIVDIVTAAAAVGALVVMGIFVYDRFVGSTAGATAKSETAEISEWRKYGEVGHRVGSASAPVRIVVFGDYECPVCASFERILQRAALAHADEIAIVYRHWPLTAIHRFAYPAARAAECAAAQGRFEAFHKLLYAKRDSLGLAPFDRLAADAGVPDLKAFARCNSVPGKVAAVEADAAAALEIGGTGTPTLLINSLRISGGPDSATLEKYISKQLNAIKAGGDTQRKR